MVASWVLGVADWVHRVAACVPHPPNSMPRMNSSRAQRLTVDGIMLGDEAPWTGVMTTLAKEPIEMMAAARLEQSTTTWDTYGCRLGSAIIRLQARAEHGHLEGMGA